MGFVTVSEQFRKEWCQCQSKTLKGPARKVRAILHRLILGLGGSTVRNPSKVPHILGN